MYGDRAAEQHEKDQPSQYDADTLAYLEAAGISGALLNRVRNLVKRAAEQPSEIAVPETCSFCGASGATIGIGDDGMCINVYKCQERRDMNKAFEQGKAEGRRVANQPPEIAVPKPAPLSRAQREVLQQAADDHGIDRWSVSGSRLRTLTILWDRGYLSGTSTVDLRITAKGRKALR